MSTDIVAFDQSMLPSYMQEALANGELEQALAKRESINQLTFRGKVWRAIVNGEENVVLNEEGDPKSTINVVILKFNDNRSRSYYEGEYKEGENRAPTCWSADGKTPDKEVAEPMCGTCADCPMAAKGSRMSMGGKPAVACTSFKNLVVIPAEDMNFPAMRLRLPQTSIWDKETEGEQWMAFDQYRDFLRGRGMPNMNVLVSRVKFDSSKAYPKLLFSFDAQHQAKLGPLLTEAEFHKVMARMKEDFGVLLGTKPMSAGTPALAAPVSSKPLTPVAALDTEEVPVPKAEKPKAKAAPAPVEAAAPKVEKNTAPPAGLAALVDEWDDE